MKVFLTGATGFVGTYILKELLAAEHEVRVLVRPGSEDRLGVAPDAVEIVHGDVTEPDTLAGKLDGCEVVIHLVGIIREDGRTGSTFERVHLDGARNVVDAAKAAGVKRFILMSANGAKPREEAVSAYQWTKYEAEEYLKQSGLEYVVFRPSVVFGRPAPGQPEFASQLARDLLRLPRILPLPLFQEGWPSLASLVKSLWPFARGWQQDLVRRYATYELQPVAVENVAAAFVQAVTDPAVANRTYEAGGRDRFRWGELLDVLTYARGRRRPRWKAVVPAFVVRLALRVPLLRSLLPITRDQFDMLTEGNVCRETAFFRDFSIKPIRFTPEAIAYTGLEAHAPMSTATAVPAPALSRRRGKKWVIYHHPVPPTNTGILLQKFGMWVFLASEVMFFTGLIGAYIILRNASAAWPRPDDMSLGLVAGMTFILIMSSMTLVWALSGIQQGKPGRLKLFLLFTILLGGTFVGLQFGAEWPHFLAHHPPTQDAFWNFFYTLTGFHGAHVSLGVVALSVLFVHAVRGKFSATNYHAIEVTGLYWHFVDLVWIILFTIIYLV